MKRRIIAAGAALAFAAGLTAAIAIPASAAKPPPPAPTLTVTTVTVTSEAYTADNTFPQGHANCPPGTMVTGGGYDTNSPGEQILSSRPAPDGSEGWFVDWTGGSFGQTIFVFARCATITP